jgi:hypothetical protein
VEIAMAQRAHLIAGLLAPLCIASFFLATLLTELFGSHAAVAQLKALIVTPGLGADRKSGRLLTLAKRSQQASQDSKLPPAVTPRGARIGLADLRFTSFDFDPHVPTLDVWSKRATSSSSMSSKATGSIQSLMSPSRPAGD